MASIRFNYDRIRTASMLKKAGCGFGGMGGSSGSSGFGSGGSGFGGYGFGSPGTRISSNRFNPVYDDLSEGTIIEQFMPVDPRRLHRIWRRIKLQDPVAGPAIDLYSELPWSNFQLIGIEDREILKLYQDALNAINCTAYLPEISAEFLAMGKVIGHLIMDESKGIWKRMIIHDPDWIRVTPIPVPGFQPKLDIIPTPDMRAWAHSKDPRDLDAQQEIKELAQMIRAGAEIPLPNENTFYIPRRASPYDAIGASIYTRIIMFVAYEKALVNATIAASRRRASRIRHITAGIDDVWEPSKEELDDYSQLFMEADSDPVGAIVVTRTGVTANEVGGSSVQDIVKISDEWQFLLQGRLNALGISESFLSGDASYQTLDNAMSVLLEKVKAHRKFFEHALIYDRLLKPLAKRHGFVHRKKAEIAHRIRIARDESDTNYILPTISWEKSLRPVADRDYLEILQMMEEKGIPITKKTWTAASGFNLESEMEQFDDDLETSRQLAAQKKRLTALAPEAASAAGGGGLDLGGGGGLGGLGGMGGDLGGLGGGLGGDMGGGLGDMGGGAPPPDAGGAPAGGGLELPQIGASVRVAAAKHHSEDRKTLESLRSLPVWSKKKEFMGVSVDAAELAARRLLDSVGERLTRNLTKAEARKILSTGNNRRDQVLRYLMTRIGIISNADIPRDVAQDISRELQSLLSRDPEALRKELRAVASCAGASDLKRREAEIEADTTRSQFFKEESIERLSTDVASLVGSEKRHVASQNLLTGFVES